MAATLPRGTAAAVRRRLTPIPERALPREPLAWIRSELDEFVWSKQRDIIQSVTEHRKTAVQSAHGTGKSWIASRLAAWWVSAHPIGEAMVLTSAPSAHQTRTILWGEISRAHRRGSLPGSITLGAVPEWQIDGHVVGIGRKPADYVDAAQARAQFQGIHSPNLLVILDEAGGIPEYLWEATSTLITSENSRMLVVGNPDDPTTTFAKMCAPGQGYHVIKVSAFDCPAFTGEAIPEQLKDSLVGHLWVDEATAMWGEESPLYISKVLGEFPETSDDVLISPRLIREAHERDRSGYATKDAGRFGMDVARMGADETCIYQNRGGMIRLEAAWRKQSTDISAARARNLLLRPENYQRHMQIDLPGLGAGVFDPLAAEGFNVQAFNGGEQAHDPQRFVNRNAEAWWSFREGLEAGLIDLDPDDLTLAAQLQNRKWKLDSSQRRIAIESKDDMRKRGVPSPDRGDAAVLSHYVGTRTVDDMAAFLARDPDEPRSITHGLLTQLT